MNQKIAVIGISFKYPDINSKKDFKEYLQSGKFVPTDGWIERGALMNIPDYNKVLNGNFPLINDIEYFDNKFFGIIKKEAVELTPEMKMSLLHIAGTIYDAGYSIKQISGTECGLVISSSSQSCDYLSVLNKRSSVAALSAREATLGEKLSYHLDFRGPVFSVDSTCSSSLLGISQAVDILNNKYADLMLVGGVQLFIPPNADRAYALLSGGNYTDTYIPFDEKASGLLSGEGIGFALLKRYDDAVRDNDYIYGVIIGTGISGTKRGNRVSSYAPDGVSQSIAIKRAWEKAGITADDITEIEAHGSATELGDAEEVSGLEIAFKNRTTPEDVLLSCVKSNIGHTSQCAGISGLIKVLLGFENHEAYPIANFIRPKSTIDFKAAHLKPIDSTVKFSENKKRIAGIDSYGLNALNVHIVVENHINTCSTLNNIAPDNRVLKITARTQKSFDYNVKAIKDYIKNSRFNLNDIIYTLNIGRDDYKFKAALYFETKEDLIDKLEDVKPVNSENSDIIIDINKIPESISDIIKNSDKENAEIAEVLINNGYTVDFSKYYNGCSYHKVPVISYQFDKVYNWPIEKKVFSNKKSEQIQVQNNISEYSDVKEKIIKIWQEILETNDEINENETFFELGGNSMLASILIESINDTFDCEMQLMDIYSYNTISEIYEFVKEQSSGKTISDSSGIVSDKSTPEPDNEDIENKLKKIWEEILETDEEIKINETFFELGGNSMLASILIESINDAFDCEIQLMDIYSYNTIYDMSEHIKELKM